MMEYDAQYGGGKWTSNVKNILTSIGKGESWNNRTSVNIANAQTELLKMYEEMWKDQIAQKPKLRTYNLVKHKYQAELYLKANLPKWRKSLISS